MEWSTKKNSSQFQDKDSGEMKMESATGDEYSFIHIMKQETYMKGRGTTVPKNES